MRWTIAQVAGALGAPPGAKLDPLARLAGVSIDSRTIRPGELFIAIHGPRHDGHDHVAAALERGALAAVVARAQWGRYAEIVRQRSIAVADTFEALQQLARAMRQAWGGKIAGITGSVGKTTTKEILAALLGSRFRVLKSEGNFNNQYGLPLTLFQLEESHGAAVLEMGMSRPGELARLAAMAMPNVAVITRVAPAHLEFFASLEDIARAKRELVEGLNGPESVAVLNADDPLVRSFRSQAPGQVLTYGMESPADFCAEAIEDRGALGSAFIVRTSGKRTRLELALAGSHAVSNALGALAAASVWGMEVADAQPVFSTLRAPAMRGELLQFTNGIGLINDSYNSSPVALQAMIQVLAATPNYSRRILAAGEMRELGNSSPEWHRQAGVFAAKTGKIDWIVGVAGDAREIVEGAAAAGLPRTRTKFFASSDEAAEFFSSFLARGDLLLVKGSRGVKMERVVEALLARHAPELATAEKTSH